MKKELVLCLLLSMILELSTGDFGYTTAPYPVNKQASQAIASTPVNKQPVTGNIQVYEIKGSSDLLSNREKQSLAKWKEQVTDYANNSNDYVYLNGYTLQPEVCLTFDDGPDGHVTPKILDILKAQGVHASFFFIGQNVKAFPAVVKRAYDEGNLVLNHTYTHPLFYNKSSEFVSDEILRTDDVIKNVIGKTPALVRPPYGIVTDNVLNTAKMHGDKLVIWSTDTFDWSQKDASHIAGNVLQNVRPGEIVLMHSNGDKTETAKALPLIIEGLKAKGYKIVTLDQLLNTNAYKN